MSWAGRTEKYELSPGESRSFWSGNIDETFIAAFDSSFDDGYTPRHVSMSGAARGAEPTACSDAQVYRFHIAGRRNGIAASEWKPGFAHPFFANLVATGEKNSWGCEPGYRCCDPTDPANLQCIAGTGIVGISLSSAGDAKYPTIAKVRAGGPAGRAGVPDGASLVSIDGVSTEGKTSADVAEQLRGAVGAEVAIGFAVAGGLTQYVTVLRE